MFTGIIEEIGEVINIKRGEKSSRIKIKCSKVIENTSLGDSIATNGVCLTVTDIKNNYFEADVMAETLRKSNLSKLKLGEKVNLERALAIGDRLGGHIVSGHIDGVGKILSKDKEDNATWISIKAEKEILKYIIYKGSIAIDGISLTVAYVDSNMFKVSIIPHTGSKTILLDKSIGDCVNLECDMIGKYVEKLFLKENSEEKKEKITKDYLIENGFF